MNYFQLHSKGSTGRCIVRILTCALFFAIAAQFTVLSGSTVLEVYVNSVTGLDSNPGTVDRPVKTISRGTALAMQNYANGIGTNIEIASGIYREAVSLTGNGAENGPPIAYRGSQTGSVIVTGSYVWTGWTQDVLNPNLYSQSWPYRWGQCTPPQGWPTLAPIVLRREMIFLNGALLTQVMSQAQMQAGTFFVDESHGRVYIWVPTNTDMRTASVEVSTRPTLFYSDRVSNLTLSRLQFQNANSCISTANTAAVVISNASYVTVEDSSFTWNNWTGGAFYNLKSPTILRVHGDNNGELGINGWRIKNGTVQDVNTSYNDWRGLWGGFDTWDTGGGKFLLIHGATFTNYTAVHNGGRGIWFDTDNANIVVDGAILAHNTRNGVFVEKSEGPVTVSNSRICGSGNEGVLTNSPSVTLSDDLIFGNQSAQIYLDGEGGTLTVQDWETLVYYQLNPEKLSLLQGTYNGTDNQLLLKLNFVSTAALNRFFSNLNSTGNTWYNPTQSSVFQWYVTGSGTQTKNFSGWQSASHQDLNSSFAPPLVNNCSDIP
jgi:Right handed beta helix region